MQSISVKASSSHLWDVEIIQNILGTFKTLLSVISCGMLKKSIFYSLFLLNQKQY